MNIKRETSIYHNRALDFSLSHKFGSPILEHLFPTLVEKQEAAKTFATTIWTVCLVAIGGQRFNGLSLCFFWQPASVYCLHMQIFAKYIAILSYEILQDLFSCKRISNIPAVSLWQTKTCEMHMYTHTYRADKRPIHAGDYLDVSKEVRNHHCHLCKCLKRRLHSPAEEH